MPKLNTTSWRRRECVPTGPDDGPGQLLTWSRRPPVRTAPDGLACPGEGSQSEAKENARKEKAYRARLVRPRGETLHQWISIKVSFDGEPERRTRRHEVLSALGKGVPFEFAFEMPRQNIDGPNRFALP